MILYHLVRADFLERVRRYSFLIVLGATLYLSYAFTAGHIVLRLDRYQGIYNSAWVGLLVAITATFFLSLAGFYIVKNALERDRRTGVGEIIATTPLSKLLYILGKTLSNVAVFVVIVIILILAAAAMQLVRGEELRIRLGPLVSPFLLILLPTMAVAAAVAVLFETLPWLRGGLGNVTYFFVWVSFITHAYLHPSPFLDLLGLSMVEDVFMEAARAGLLDYTGGLSIEMVKFMPTHSVHWEGIPWTPERVVARLYWVGVAVAVVLVAVAVFDRFDPARDILHRYDFFKGARRGLLGRWRKRLRPDVMPSVALEVKGLVPTPVHIRLVPLAITSKSLRFRQMLLAELRLMLKGQRWWWYAIALGLVAASLFVPIDGARQLALPVAWMWPVLIWSAMGNRAVRHHTEQLFFSAPHPLRRQLPAAWLAGVIVALLAGGGVGVRLILAGDWAGVQAWTVGALFIPTLALALGTWSGSSKPFEAIYTLLWYVGPVNQTPALDFMGAVDESVAAGVPWYYMALTIILLGLAVIGQKQRLRV